MFQACVPLKVPSCLDYETLGGSQAGMEGQIDFRGGRVGGKWSDSSYSLFSLAFGRIG